MRITLTRPTIVDKRHVAAGATVETDDRTADRLIAMGKAVAAAGKPAARKRKTAVARRGKRETATAED